MRDKPASTKLLAPTVLAIDPRIGAACRLPDRSLICITFDPTPRPGNEAFMAKCYAIQNAVNRTGWELTELESYILEPSPVTYSQYFDIGGFFGYLGSKHHNLARIIPQRALDACCGLRGKSGRQRIAHTKQALIDVAGELKQDIPPELLPVALLAFRGHAIAAIS